MPLWVISKQTQDNQASIWWYWSGPPTLLPSEQKRIVRWIHYEVCSFDFYKTLTAKRIAMNFLFFSLRVCCPSQASHERQRSRCQLKTGAVFRASNWSLVHSSNVDSKVEAADWRWKFIKMCHCFGARAGQLADSRDYHIKFHSVTRLVFFLSLSVCFHSSRNAVLSRAADNVGDTQSVQHEPLCAEAWMSGSTSWLTLLKYCRTL